MSGLSDGKCLGSYKRINFFCLPHNKVGGDNMTDKQEKAFGTFPLADVKEVDDASNVSIPSEKGVEEVKGWVDSKEM
jgi:hypothetical protein